MTLTLTSGGKTLQEEITKNGQEHLLLQVEGLLPYGKVCGWTDVSTMTLCDDAVDV